MSQLSQNVDNEGCIALQLFFGNIDPHTVIGQTTDNLVARLQEAGGEVLYTGFMLPNEPLNKFKEHVFVVSALLPATVVMDVATSSDVLEARIERKPIDFLKAVGRKPEIGNSTGVVPFSLHREFNLDDFII